MLTSNNVAAQQEQQLVRLAKLVIDPAQLEKYYAILKEEIQDHMMYKLIFYIVGYAIPIFILLTMIGVSPCIQWYPAMRL